MSKFGYQEMLEGNRPYLQVKYLNKLALSMTRTVGFHSSQSTTANLNAGGFVKANETNPFRESNSPQRVKDPNDSEIPAGYTYLGQFLDHDISKDSKSDRGNSAHHPFSPIDISDIRNLQNPVFDLETIYGRFKEGKLPDKNYLENDGASLKLGETFNDLNDGRVRHNDFFRETSGKPLIADARNDGNLLLAQIQVAFMKFHNAVVKELSAKPKPPTNLFQKARKIVIRHYQYIILNDFLPTFVQDSILQEVRAHFGAKKNNRFYNPPPNNLFLPLEFAVGAFRFGHSIIRNRYNLNKLVLEKHAKLGELVDFIRESDASFENKLRSSWVVNWRLFFDIENSRKDSNFNFSRKINTRFDSLLGVLRRLPIPSADPKINSLSAIDLYRGVRWALPNGQSVAAKIADKQKQTNARILSKNQIKETLTNDFTDIEKDELSENTPFIYYILAEAEKQMNGEKLGDVGSWIIAEVFIKLLYESPYSILKDKLEGDKYFLGNKFGMTEMLLYTRETLNKDFDEIINPIG